MAHARLHVNGRGSENTDAPPFRVTRHSDVDAVLGRLVRLYCRVGVAYAKSIAKYEALLPLLRSRVGLMPEYPQRTAACLYLMGRANEARSVTELLDRAPVECATQALFAAPAARVQLLATTDAGIRDPLTIKSGGSNIRIDSHRHTAS